MITKRHTVQLTVNGNYLDIENQDALNLRINSVLYDPSKIVSTTGEYSFSFDLPCTPTNNRIFGFVNVPSVTNKFNKVYSTKVYGDGNLVFEGNLKINSIEQGKYKVNLVNIKTGSLTDIFREDKMNDLSWYVPYDGITTIEDVNSKDLDYFFPLVSYGPFQKLPKATYSNEFNAYTSKYLLDKYVQWYDSSFSPSVKLVELVRRYFDRKGYSISGDAFDDPIINSIFLSTHLADGQIPLYNLGNPKLGKCTVKWNNWHNVEYYSSSHGSSTWTMNGLVVNLAFPHKWEQSAYHYQFESARIYDIWEGCHIYNDREAPTGRPDGLYGMHIEADNPYLFKDDMIVIPTTGAYKIDMDVEMSLEGAKSMADIYFWKNAYDDEEKRSVPIDWDSMPFEVQLVRNEHETELIYGCDGKAITVYPHEAPGTSDQSTIGINPSVPRSYESGNHRTKSRGDSTGYDPDDPSSRGSGDSSQTADFDMGYVSKFPQILAYDPYVNANFLCGFSSIGQCPSVLKRGYSWNPSVSEYNHARYDLAGYYGVNYSDGAYEWITTTWNQNNYPGSPLSTLVDDGVLKKKGHVSCLLWLNAGDTLFLKGVIRRYQSEYIRPVTHESQRTEAVYKVICSGQMTIEAYSPKQSDIDDKSLRYNNPTKFDTDLNLAQFQASNVKQSDFIQNFINALNLNFRTEGNVAVFNKNKIDFSLLHTPVNIDDRVNNDDIITEPVDYPKTMQIRYSIKDDEAGFYNSVPADHINDDDWKDWAFTGSDKINLNPNEDADDEEKVLTNGYTWYNDFTIQNTDDAEPTIISIPLIAKDENMIDNYKVEESMKTDGKGLPQRWWFRGDTLSDIPFTDVNGNTFHVTLTKNEKDGVILDYTTNGRTLLTEYFNITAFTNSNYVTAETYLTASEYQLIRQGAPIRLDSDIYYTCKITGYDPTGNNTTQIQALKKS